MLTAIVLTLLILISATLHIRAEYSELRQQIYIFKPLTMALIILLAILAQEPISCFYHVMIVVGLLFSLGGDVFLMLPNKFLPGLVSFLIAHVFYSVAFAVEGDFPLVLWTLLILAGYGVLVLRLLWPHLEDMKLPVAAYMTIILLMGWFAVNRSLETDQAGSLLAAVGALLFVASDTFLAFNRFRGAYRSAQFLVMSTYFAAQWLIANSI